MKLDAAILRTFGVPQSRARHPRNHARDDGNDCGDASLKAAQLTNNVAIWQGRAMIRPSRADR